MYVLIMAIYLEKKRGRERGKERDGVSMEGRTEREIYVAST